MTARRRARHTDLGTTGGPGRRVVGSSRRARLIEEGRTETVAHWVARLNSGSSPGRRGRRRVGTGPGSASIRRRTVLGSGGTSIASPSGPSSTASLASPASTTPHMPDRRHRPLVEQTGRCGPAAMRTAPPGSPCRRDGRPRRVYPSTSPTASPIRSRAPRRSASFANAEVAPTAGPGSRCEPGARHARRKRRLEDGHGAASTPGVESGQVPASQVAIWRGRRCRARRAATQPAPDRSRAEPGRRQLTVVETTDARGPAGPGRPDAGPRPEFRPDAGPDPTRLEQGDGRASAARYAAAEVPTIPPPTTSTSGTGVGPGTGVRTCSRPRWPAGDRSPRR
jgi:hypothetical protein